MKRPPRPRNERLLTARGMAKAYLLMGPIEAAAAMLAFFMVYFNNGFTLSRILEIGVDPNNYVSSTVYQSAITASFAAIVLSQIGNAFANRTTYDSVFKAGFFRNRLLLWAIIGEVAILNMLIYIPGLNGVFNHYPIGWISWIVPILFIPSVLIIEEIRKLIIRHFRKISYA